MKISNLNYFQSLYKDSFPHQHNNELLLVFWNIRDLLYSYASICDEMNIHPLSSDYGSCKIYGIKFIYLDPVKVENTEWVELPLLKPEEKESKKKQVHINTVLVDFNKIHLVRECNGVYQGINNDCEKVSFIVEL